MFSDEALKQATTFSYARHVGTRRGAQDLVYRMFAVATIEHYCEAFPEKRDALAWYFHPRLRHTLLTELGRMAGLRSTPTGSLEWSERGVERLVAAALHLAETQPSTKDGVRILRAARVRGQDEPEDSSVTSRTTEAASRTDGSGDAPRLPGNGD